MSSRAVVKAKAAVKASNKSASGKTFKIRHTTRFVNSAQKTINRTKFDKVKGYKVPLHRDINTTLLSPLSTEKAVRKMEDNNTLVFYVQEQANKKMIKAAVESRFQVEVKKVNTLITPRMKKKAYVRLTAEHDALAIAHKIGFI
eukprot:GHVH01007008.1.p1 GENE.GHVH01007008.1~~GHVH01007008.1.p1  ORF type:complete len:144 (+),score=28.71 GHVH01007008.1:100-531(+)